MQLLNMHNVHPEVRAFIYQQMADLERFLPEGSNVSILINDDLQSRKLKKVSATIRIQTPYGDLRALGETGDIYHSLQEAKAVMLRQLGEMHRMSSEQDRTFDVAMDSTARKLH